jgi:N-methylhydantoinase B
MTTHATGATQSVALRDLRDEDYLARYGCDRFTASVLGSRMRYIVIHMATGLLRQAFSPIIAYMYDFATAIVGPPELDYAMPAVNNGLAVFIGTVPDAVRNAVEEHGPERLVEGDLLICNDPSRVANHPNDMCFIMPCFAEGELSGFLAVRAHQLDMGGTVPGGFSGTKRNTYENGLVLGPQLLYAAGRPVKSTFSLIFDNARMGELLLPDLKTVRQSCALGSELLVDTIQRYGRDAVMGAMRFSCDDSAEAAAEAISRIPDGDYVGRSMIDADNAGDDEEYEIVARVAKRGKRVEVDFSGSSRQARTCINSHAIDAKTAAGVGLNMLLGVTTPFTSGSFRPIDVVIPPGTIASALPPDGAIFFYWEVESAILTALIVALRDAIGEHGVGGDFGSTGTHNAFGTHPDGTPWITMAECGGEYGAWGASRAGDGDGYNTLYFVNMLSPATEFIESKVPAMVMRKEYVADSAGPGTHRGGAGMVKDVLYLQEAEHHTMPLRLKAPSGVGVDGGAAGRVGGVWIFDQDGVDDPALLSTDDEAYAQATPVAGLLDPHTHLPSPDGTYHYFARVHAWHTAPGATFRYLTNGGGGWGQPLERDPARVARDVRDGYSTIEGARRDYGVVIVGDPEQDPEGVHVDEQATRELRAKLQIGQNGRGDGAQGARGAPGAT